MSRKLNKHEAQKIKDQAMRAVLQAARRLKEKDINWDASCICLRLDQNALKKLFEYHIYARCILQKTPLPEFLFTD